MGARRASWRVAALTALLALLSAWTAAAAGTVTGTDGRVVHYGSMNTDQLSAEVAQRLEIRPRASHALLVLSPRDAQGRSVAASASGEVRRLTGQRQTLAFLTRGEPGQQDLIAEFEIQDGEHLDFEIRIRLEGEPYPLDLRFRRQFYRGN